MQSKLLRLVFQTSKLSLFNKSHFRRTNSSCFYSYGLIANPSFQQIRWQSLNTSSNLPLSQNDMKEDIHQTSSSESLTVISTQQDENTAVPPPRRSRVYKELDEKPYTQGQIDKIFATVPLHEMSGDDVCKILMDSGRLRSPLNIDRFMDKIIAVLTTPSVARSLKTKDAVKIIYSFGAYDRLDDAPSRITLANIVISYFSRSNIPAMDNKSFGLVMFGLRRMKASDGKVRELLTVLTDQLRQDAEPLSEADAGAILYGCQSLDSDHVEVRALIEQITMKVQSCTEPWSERTISSALQGFRSMNANEPEVRMLVDAVTAHIRKFQGTMKPEGLAAVKGLQRMSSGSVQVRNLLIEVRRLVESCTQPLWSSEVADMLSGLRSMCTSYAEVRELLTAVTAAADTCSEPFDSKNVSFAMNGINMMSSERVEVLALVRVLSRLMSTCPSLDKKGFGNAISGLQGLSSEHVEVKVLLKELTRLVKTSSGALTADTVSRALYGCRSLNTEHPEAAALINALSEALNRFKRKLSLLELDVSIYGLISAGKLPTEFVSFIETQLHQSPPFGYSTDEEIFRTLNFHETLVILSKSRESTLWGQLSESAQARVHFLIDKVMKLSTSEQIQVYLSSRGFHWTRTRMTAFNFLVHILGLLCNEHKIPVGDITLQRGALLLGYFEADIIVKIESPKEEVVADSIKNKDQQVDYQDESRMKLPPEVNDEIQEKSNQAKPVLLNIEIDLPGRQHEARVVLYRRRDALLNEAGIQVIRMDLTDSKTLNTPERRDLFDSISKQIINMYLASRGKDLIA